MTKSILLVGVGGQGTILASKLLTIGLMSEGYDVKMSEIHGMSQRGGSVSSHILYGEKVQSPVIEKGGADILVSFEIMEALRYLDYLKIDGRIVVNNYKINPMPVAMGKCVYPQDILNQLSSKVNTTVINAYNEAKDLGNMKTMNMVMLGTIIKQMNLTGIDWNTIVRDNVKANFVEANIAAIDRGKELA